MKNNKHYKFQITWSNEDQEFVGLCTEFPSLSWLDKSYEGALSGIINMVNIVVDDMKADGEKIPEPIVNMKEIEKAWSVISPYLTQPKNDHDLKMLIDFTLLLIGYMGEDDGHPLKSLLELVGNLIEKYEDKHIPNPDI